jgi:hypothetical protein
MRRLLLGTDPAAALPCLKIMPVHHLFARAESARLLFGHVAIAAAVTVAAPKTVDAAVQMAPRLLRLAASVLALIERRRAIHLCSLLSNRALLLLGSIDTNTKRL